MTAVEMSALVVVACAAFDHDFPQVAERLAAMLAPHVADAHVHIGPDSEFPDGESYAELPHAVIGKKIVICQSLSSAVGGSVNHSLMSLLTTIRGYREYGAAQITVFVPYLAYSRQDRQMPGQRRPTTAQLVAEMLAVAGVDRMIAINSGASGRLGDLYSPVPLSFLETDTFFFQTLLDETEGDAVIVAPDRGARAQARRIAARLHLSIAYADKHRIDAETVRVRLSDSDALRGHRRAIIVDDLVCSAGSVEKVIEALRFAGVSSARIVAPHLRLTATGAARLTELSAAGALERVDGLDSAPTGVALEGVHRHPFLDFLGPALVTELVTALRAVMLA
ncbi:ribose-phosphate diphosphokinase [Rathayibacter toxicus]|uniref:ribose-phosphate diphosphokinase n=1 Tax=Rathayibacter toxicus TaxID=145458 RepID=A0A0C5BBC3_9MICO|nr:ribose-phosphate diphosphokinase [Rathayibacter toxicus]AJM78208.1 hypothetical protein TI83_10280 [Rathayibacter toxicus]ALS57508.1 hypothetical protein APU90_06785 [Rathayibacter toxicus]KKM46787.1 hypothetical protein VT73_01915 [Rathayibacter toxicus]PPG20822.1 hypothetical protein C5D15_10140 [Rathayibacter toxicus]PPG45926.1 hypothetical protein C5D16_10110 [Rathayibacter toxicus]